MNKVVLTDLAKYVVNNIIAPFVEENQDLMLDDKYFTGYYRDTIEDNQRCIRPIFDFDPFLIPIIAKIVTELKLDIPEDFIPDLYMNNMRQKAISDLKYYLNHNNNQILISIKNKHSRSTADVGLIFYFNLNIDLPKVANTCAEFLL